MNKTITIVAGIDVAKAKLDVAIHGCKLRWQVTNDLAGFHDLAGTLRSRKVTRVGLEATGGYERDVVEYLRKAGFSVVVLQPRQVRAFAEFILCRANRLRRISYASRFGSNTPAIRSCAASCWPTSSGSRPAGPK